MGDWVVLLFCVLLGEHPHVADLLDCGQFVGLRVRDDIELFDDVMLECGVPFDNFLVIIDLLFGEDLNVVGNVGFSQE